MPSRNTAIARLLAVIALGAAAVSVIVVVGSTAGDGGSKADAPRKSAAQKKQAKKNRKTPKVYEVKEGDNLSMIADRTGVSVDEIEELNPDLDPQALTIGQKLKLR